jgi:CheY-like chemotaxis protein
VKSPGGSGLSILRTIRSSEVLARLPVVIFSSSVAVEDRNQAQMLGADEFIVNLRNSSRQPKRRFVWRRKARRRRRERTSSSDLRPDLLARVRQKWQASMFSIFPGNVTVKRLPEERSIARQDPQLHILLTGEQVACLIRSGREARNALGAGRDQEVFPAERLATDGNLRAGPLSTARPLNNLDALRTFDNAPVLLVPVVAD